MTVSNSNGKTLLKSLRNALYNFDGTTVLAELTNALAPDVLVQLSYPFTNMHSSQQFYDLAYKPLNIAIPDLERRETIVMSGISEDGSHWVGFCGYYTGSFENNWLDIPATGHQVSMRFHEFYRISNNKVIEIQAIWDIPEMMMQANAWPMVPSLGKEWHVPAPATQDGLSNHDDKLTTASIKLVGDMCKSLANYADAGVEAMELDKYWHPKCSWYGPSGIGTCRGIKGFRNWHQIPFLNAMPNRVGDVEQGYLFGDGNYVAFTAWPGMHMTISNDGWLGIAPMDKKITMRSLDFWRCEQNLIRENWVLVDLLHVYEQIGVDVLARMREMTKRC
jgi:predicted ester cyclase